MILGILAVGNPGIPQGEDESVTAGVGGFLVLFFLGLATYLLMRNMNARLRRMRWRAEQEELREEAPREAEQFGESPGPSGHLGHPGPGVVDRPPAGARDGSEGRRDRPVDRE